MPIWDLVRSLQPLYIVSGIIVGALVGMTGVGGGSLMTPLLILLFGVHPATAVGTDLLYAAATKTAGSAVHGWRGTIDFKVVLKLALGSVPATAATVLLLHSLDVNSAIAKEFVSRVLGGALLVTAVCLVLRDRLMAVYRGRVENLPLMLVSCLTVMTGALLGVMVTLSSVGAGAVGVTALFMLYPNMDVKKIVGSDIAHAVPLTLVAGLGHFALGSVNLSILASLLAGSVPAVIVASLFAGRISETLTRFILASVLVVVCIRFWFFR